MSKEFISIGCHPSGTDAKMFIEVINQGIDAHLEGFTKSKFYYTAEGIGQRFKIELHRSEVSIMVRRLRERGLENSDQWADDIEELV